MAKAKGKVKESSAPILPAYQIETWPLGRLKSYDRNARKHSPAQVEQLRGSFKKFGQVWPLLVREDGTIIAGHGRLEAAKAEGFTDVRVIIATGWSEEQCRAFGLLDNQVALNSEWDEELLGLELADLSTFGVPLGDLGFGEAQLGELLAPNGKEQPKKKERSTELNPVIQFNIVFDDERQQEQFRDEELIPDEVIDFVDEYRRKDWIKMVWFAVPLASTKYTLGVCRSYVQWDPARKWVRPKPEWAESLTPGDDRVFDQYTMDAFTAQKYRGKIAFLTGIRSAESLIRYRACVNKLNENYINAVTDPKAANVKLCKPIFDWEENDVFRYFYDRKIKYCSLYDLQMWAGNSLRVSTPLHAESAKKFDLIKTTVPGFYQRVTDVFPEMLAHERYFKEMDREALHAQYGQTYEGVRQWIDENIEEEKQYDAAVVKFESVMQRAEKNPDLYPPRYLLTTFMAGSFKREILPQGKPKPDERSDQQHRVA